MSELIALLNSLKDKLTREDNRCKELERQLRQLESQFRSTVEMQTDLITLSKADGTVLYMNKANCDFFGTTPGQFVGHTFEPLIPVEDRETSLKKFHSISLSNPIVVNLHRVINGKGEIRWMEWINRGTFDEEGTLQTILANGRDITDQVLAEQALRQSNQFLDSLFDNIPTLIVIIEAKNLRVERINRFAEDHLKIKRSLYIGKFLGDIIGDEQFKVFEQLQKEPVPKQGVLDFPEVPITGEDLRERLFHARIIPLQDQDGEVHHFLAILEDITEQKRIEEETQQLLEKSMELNRLKSNIITLTSHELKTPLTAIYGWTKFMLAKKQQGKKLDRVVDIEILSSLVRNAERLDNLINSYLDVGRIESDNLHLNPVKCDVEKILQSSIQTINPLAREKGIQLKISSFPLELELDADRFEQVLTNLLSNSIKYSPETSKISVNFGRTQFDEVGERFFITIKDEGYGFTPEELRVAMEPFPNIYNQRTEKANVKGTGLGLYISKNIIEKLGGSISIKSEGPNKGSIVIVAFPISSL